MPFGCDEVAFSTFVLLPYAVKTLHGLYSMRKPWQSPTSLEFGVIEVYKEWMAFQLIDLYTEVASCFTIIVYNAVGNLVAVMVLIRKLISYKWSQDSIEQTPDAEKALAITVKEDYKPFARKADYELLSLREMQIDERLLASGSRYTMEEVAKHKSKDDCWVVVNGLVLDVTKWLPVHLGGDQAILSVAGTDASTEWNMIHPPDVISRNAPDSVIGQLCLT